MAIYDPFRLQLCFKHLICLHIFTVFLAAMKVRCCFEIQIHEQDDILCRFFHDPDKDTFLVEMDHQGERHAGTHPAVQERTKILRIQRQAALEEALHSVEVVDVPQEPMAFVGRQSAGLHADMPKPSFPALLLAAFS